MSTNEKEYKYVLGIFDTITKDIRNSILKNSEESKILGIGVYTDKCCETTLFTRPMKPLEHRMQIAQGLFGVAFTFPVDNIQQCEVEKVADKFYEQYVESVKQSEYSKKYKAGFVIGSFDLLHAGHIENINLASAICQDLYVVVKTDERIMAKKKKQPIQNTTERAANLRALKQVKDVLFYDLDSTRSDLIKNVISQYQKDHPGETIEEKEIVAIFGEDLREKEEKRQRDGDWGSINLEFTPRPKEKMQVISSSVYQGIILASGGLEAYEGIELKGLVNPMEYTDSNISMRDGNTK